MTVRVFPVVLLLGACHEPAPATASDATPEAFGDAASDVATEDSAAPPDVAEDAAEPRPQRPPALTAYVTGSDGDAPGPPAGPALLLMGGGTDVDEAFGRWLPYAAGGDVVVLRTSGEDGYNAYLYEDIGGIDSVETLLVTTPALANDPYVDWTLARAEAIFLAGGDQATYLRAWRGTAVERRVEEAWSRGAAIGGTSAGLAVLGEFVYAAYEGSTTSEEALADPYVPELDRNFLALPLLTQTITDSHFAERDRMGRLVAFLARIVEDGWAEEAIGLGIDSETALVADSEGIATVVGRGRVYVVRTTGAPSVCRPGELLTFESLEMWRFGPGDALRLPVSALDGPARPLAVSAGELAPTDPY